MRGLRGFTIVSDSGLSHDKAIFWWAREQLRVNPCRGFGSLIPQLLACFVEDEALDYANHPPSKSSHTFVASQKYWTGELLKMVCMWNVWNCRKFYVRDVRGQPLPESTQPIHEYLHIYAGAEISRLEKVVLQEVDKLQGGIKLGERPTPLLLSAYHLGVWISLWQLVVMYRQSSGARLGFRKEQFRETTEELYNKVVILYSVVFRTSKALLYLIDKETGVSGVFGGKSVLGEAFDKAWRARKDFCKGALFCQWTNPLTLPRRLIPATILRR